MRARAVGIAVTVAVVAACGDDGAPGGPSGSGGASATTATASGPASSSTTGAAGGDGGAGGAGGEGSGAGGGTGGAGAAPACPLATDHVAAGASFTCVVGADAIVRCRGGSSGNGWAIATLADGGDARCVDHVAADGEGLCVRTAAGDACPTPGVWCTDDVASPLVHVGDGPIVAPLGSGACALDRTGSGTCTGLDLPELAPIAPLGGMDAGARDACAWGAGGIRCWGATSSVASDAPLLAGCPADVAVGDGFACVAWSGFDVVDCWGELPPSIPARVFIAGPAEDVAVGDRFVCARTVTGLVRCWGDDTDGGLGVAGDGSGRGEVEPDWPPEAAGVAPRAIAAGVGHVATIDGDGPRVLAWGRNAEAQVCSCPSELVDTPVDAEHPGLDP